MVKNIDVKLLEIIKEQLSLKIYQRLNNILYQHLFYKNGIKYLDN